MQPTEYILPSACLILGIMLGMALGLAVTAARIARAAKESWAAAERFHRLREAAKNS